MRDHVHQRAIARDERRRQEREARVLHAAVRKGRRHHQQVEALPVVGSEQALGGRDHRLDAVELARRRRQRLGLGPDARARREILAFDADRPRTRGGTAGWAAASRNGPWRARQRRALALHEARRHHARQLLGHVEGRAEGHAPARRVLQGHDRARMDRLALREQVRMASRSRLLGSEPAERRRPIGGVVADRQPLGVRRQRDAQARSDDGIARAELELERLPGAALHGRDRQVARVEIESATALVAPPTPRARGSPRRPGSGARSRPAGAGRRMPSAAGRCRGASGGRGGA